MWENGIIKNSQKGSIQNWIRHEKSLEGTSHAKKKSKSFDDKKDCIKEADERNLRPNVTVLDFSWRRSGMFLQQWLWVWRDGLLWDLLWLVPLSVLEIQEDVGLLDKRDYMCCFSIASRTLSLVREVKSLWKEVERLHKQNKCGSKECSFSTKMKGTNTDKISCTDRNYSSREATFLYSAMVKCDRYLHLERRNMWVGGSCGKPNWRGSEEVLGKSGSWDYLSWGKAYV